MFSDMDQPSFIIRHAIAMAPRAVEFGIAEGTDKSRRWEVAGEVGGVMRYPVLV